MRSRVYCSKECLLQDNFFFFFSVSFDRLFDISKEKKTHEYKKYLEVLHNYLYYYIQRTQPLLNVENELQEVMAEFEKRFEAGTFPGWPKEAGSALAHSGKI